MPKQFYRLNNFSGGLNTNSDPRKIRDNELSSAQGIFIDEDHGNIYSAFEASDHTDIEDRTTSLQAGFGLFIYGSDHVKGSSANDSGETWVALCDSTNAQIDLWDKTTGSGGGSGWGTTVNMYGSSATANAKAVMHFVDEGLRISDANFGANNSNRIYQYIKRTHFSGITPGGSADSYDNWFTNDQKLSAPTRGIVGDGDNNSSLGYQASQYTTSGSDTSLVDSGAGFVSALDTELDSGTYLAVDLDTGQSFDTISSRTNTTTLVTSSGGADWYVASTPVQYAIYPAAGSGFNLDISTPTGGSWVAATYQFATSFIYDGNQESLLYELPGTVTTADSDKIQCTVMCRSPFDERITGGRIYIRDSSEKGDWILFGEISLKSGVRSKSFGTYTSWELEEQTLNSDFLTANLVSLSQNLETYEILNGFSHEESAIDIGSDGEGYKTSVIANRRCFVANVKTRNDDGETIQMRDRIMYSPVGKFDTFPRSFFLDVIRGDAEEWVKLETYADRLLAFKENSLYVINISSPSPSGWFLEDSYSHMGVKNPAAVAIARESGIVWANKFGCFLFNGNTIVNLIKDKIGTGTWGLFVTDNTAVGYSFGSDKLIVLKDCSSSSDGDCYITSLEYPAWTFHDSLFADSETQTNFDFDYDGWPVLCQSSNGDFKTIKTTLGTSLDIDVKTKDIDFGNPSITKKVYAFNITYKSSATISNPISYEKEGSGNGFGTTNLSGNSFATSSGLWNTARITLTSPIECGSIRLRIAKGTGTSSTLNISDIDIEYRPIYKRVT